MDKTGYSGGVGMDHDTEIMDGIAAVQFIAWDQRPKFRAGQITLEEYTEELLEAAKKCRRAAHLHPAGNHGSSAAKLQAEYNRLAEKT